MLAKRAQNDEISNTRSGRRSFNNVLTFFCPRSQRDIDRIDCMPRRAGRCKNSSHGLTNPLCFTKRTPPFVARRRIVIAEFTCAAAAAGAASIYLAAMAGCSRDAESVC